MAKGPDPRREAVARSEVPDLLRAGAADFNARRFWHAHESWESAWHALRGAGEPEPAEFVHGLILCAAGLENALRGKEDGFKRQVASGLYLLRSHLAAAERVGVRDAAGFLDGLGLLYVDACRRLDWSTWSSSGWSAPTLEVA